MDELDIAEDVLNIPQAAAATRMSEYTIRQAIVRKELPAWIPGGRPPGASGRGVGYRIKKKDLESWYFGEEKR